MAQFHMKLSEILVGKCFRIKQFNIIKPSYYRVAGVAVDEANGSVIYEFEDKYGEFRRRPSNKRISSSIACGTRVGQRKSLNYGLDSHTIHIFM